jgi:hypothetical protein
MAGNSIQMPELAVREFLQRALIAINFRSAPLHPARKMHTS